MKKMIEKIVMGLFVILAFAGRLEAQNNIRPDSTIAEITDDIKVAFELNKLNDCRIKLRNIEFEKLTSKEAKEQYAAAYKQLAIAFRMHRYIRPGFDIYQKYIELRDTILKEEKNKLLSETKQKQDALNTSVMSKITTAENERNSLQSDKASLDSLKRNNFTFCVFLTFLLSGIFIFIFSRFNKKLKNARTMLQNNRQRVLELNDAVTKGQMSAGIFTQVRDTNTVTGAEAGEAVLLLSGVENETKNIKEAEQSLRTLKECISKIKQLSEISSKNINSVFRKIPDSGVGN